MKKGVYRYDSATDTLVPSVVDDSEILTQQINVNGCKNYVSQDAGSVVKNGITFTNNGDGTYSVSGTNTSTSAQSIYPNEETPILLKAGQKYTLSGGVSTNLALNIRKDTTGTTYTDADGNAVSVGSAARSFTNGNSDVYVYILVRVAGSATVNGIVKPMLCLKSDYDLDPTFVPYAKTNRELTEDVTNVKQTLTEIDAYNTGDVISWGASIMHPCSVSNVNGDSITFNIPLPKRIKSAGIATSYNTTINWLRGNGTQIASGLTITSVAFQRPNILQVRVSGTFSPMTVYVGELSEGSVTV